MPSDLNITKCQTSATGQKQGKSSLNIMPQQKLQTKHWTAAIMKTPGQQRLTTMKEALNEPKCKNNLLQNIGTLTLAQRIPNVCEKNVFHFFCSSTSGKQHIYFVDTCQFRPNKGVSSHISTPLHVSCYLWTIQISMKCLYINNKRTD